MSLSNSRWATQKLKQAEAKYVAPNCRQKTTNSNSNQNKNQSIIINPSDLTRSKKFSNEQPKQLDGLLNSFENSLQLHPDPMSLVPSPSRGINKKHSSKESNGDTKTQDQSSSYEDQDLTRFEFQNEYFRWFLIKRLKPYRKLHTNQINLFLHLCLKEFNFNPQDTLASGGIKDDVGKENHFKSQVDHISSLVREIRKLREGIFASGRRDSFAIMVYELSAELALEALDFAQLNTLLSTLIFDLYGNVGIAEHVMKDEKESNEGSSQTTEEEEKEVERILTQSRNTEEEILNTRLMFSRVLLLLPIVTRFDLSRFLDQFPQVCRIFDRSSTRLLSLEYLFKLLLRKNYVRINRKFIRPKLESITQHTTDGQESLTGAERAVHWDDMLYLNLLNLLRTKLIWKSMEKSYYHLDPNDDIFIFNTLSLDFSSVNKFQSINNSHGKPNFLLDVRTCLDLWLAFVNVKRNSNGTIQFKK